MKTINDVAAILSNRRKELNLEQSDMYMRIGMKQQPYQRVEAGNDVRLSTFLRILEGLDLEMELHPIGKERAATPRTETAEDSDDNIDFWLKSGNAKLKI